MATSRKPGPFGLDPFRLCSLSPGPLGVNDAASPYAPAELVGDTPGPLGCNDYAALGVNGSLMGSLYMTVSWDRDLSIWDYDPKRLLENSYLSPDFVRAAHKALASAVRSGLRPMVHEVHRTPEESDRKHKLWKEKQGGRAAPAWRSCHNYGIAMDVWLYDSKVRYIDNHVKGWYKQYKLLAKSALGVGFVWGEGFGDGDADHFEFHPNWVQGANGDFLLQVKAWAQQAAVSLTGAGTLPNNVVSPVPTPSMAEWISFFWWAAGARGNPPPASFLANNPPPRQPT
jgi:hypothetical protein